MLPIHLQRQLISDASEALVETWICGNRSDVIAAVIAAPTRIGLALAVNVAASLASPDSRGISDREDIDFAESLIDAATDFGAESPRRLTPEKWFFGELRHSSQERG
jgi:hypothetical protein